MSEAKRSTAIVTGGGGDIGRAIATRLAPEFETIVLADRNAETAQKSADGIDVAGSRIVARHCDITDTSSAADMIAAAADFGPIDLLVNNAGGGVRTSLQATAPEDWEADVTLNLNGAFHCFHAAAEHLKASSGAVVNIASVNGLAVFGHPAYSAAKAGLIHFTRSIAVEYGKFGIRANAVAPGTVRTQAWEDRLAINPNVFDDVLRWYPLQRVADTRDIANAVAFLASKQAKSITGICLPVDCGLTAGQTDLASAFTQSPHF